MSRPYDQCRGRRRARDGRGEDPG